MKDLGKKIREIRISKGLSQEDLAEKSQVSVRTIQRIEHQQNTPHGKTLQLICEALGIQAEDVLTYNQSEDYSKLSIMYFSILSGLALPLGNILVPFILWITNKSKVLKADEVGKNIVYNQIIISILIFFVLVLTILVKLNHWDTFNTNYGFLLFFVLSGLNYIFAFCAGIMANKGKIKKYPFFK